MVWMIKIGLNWILPAVINVVALAKMVVYMHIDVHSVIARKSTVVAAIPAMVFVAVTTTVTTIVVPKIVISFVI